MTAIRSTISRAVYQAHTFKFRTMKPIIDRVAISKQTVGLRGKDACSQSVQVMDSLTQQALVAIRRDGQRIQEIAQEFVRLDEAALKDTQINVSIKDSKLE